MYNQIPVEVIASWPAANTKHPESRASLLIGFEITMMMIITLSVSMRLYSRAFVIRSTGLDDWMIMPAAIFAVAQCIVACVGVDFGWGIHTWDFIAIYFDKIEGGFKLMMVVTILFGLANTFTKLSILYFYKRMCTGTAISKIVDVTIYTVMVWGFVVFWLGIFQCKPISVFWTLYTPPNSKCISDTFFKTYAGTDIFLDIWILALPLKTLWSLHLPLQKKLRLIALFSFGGLTCVAGMMRLPSILNSMTTYDLSCMFLKFLLYISIWSANVYIGEGPMLEMWSSLELAIGIACSCAPAIFSHFIIRQNNNSHKISLDYSITSSIKKSLTWKKPQPVEKTRSSVTTTRSVAAFPEPEEYAYTRQVRHSKARSEIHPGPMIELRSAFPTPEEAMQFWKNPESYERYFKRLRDMEQGLAEPVPVTPGPDNTNSQNTTTRRASVF